MSRTSLKKIILKKLAYFIFGQSNIVKIHVRLQIVHFLQIKLTKQPKKGNKLTSTYVVTQVLKNNKMLKITKNHDHCFV